jgi:predicted nucleic acid-binding protein
MGLIVDTGVVIKLEKDPSCIDLAAYRPRYGDAYLSAATCSELLVGVHLANTEERRTRRSAYVEGLFKLFRPLAFDLDVARVHAQLISSLPRNVTLGAFDLIIGATAIRYGFAVLTTNPADFRRMPGCLVEPAERS